MAIIYNILMKKIHLRYADFKTGPGFKILHLRNI